MESYELKRLKEMHFSAINERDKAMADRQHYLNLLQEMCLAIESGDDARLRSVYLASIPAIKAAGK